jgi:hypothetical protein
MGQAQRTVSPCHFMTISAAQILKITMKLRIFIARRMSKRLAREACSYRRALRDHLRKETGLIRKLEIRSRGLRLYAAWASGGSNVTPARPETWPQATLPEAAGILAQEPLLVSQRLHVH